MELRIHRKFDLKDSSSGRSADKVEVDENTIRKDLDLKYCFYLEPTWRDARLNKFMESEDIMDYSLLLGVHYVDALGIVSEDGNSTCSISHYIWSVLDLSTSSNGKVSLQRESSSTGDEEVDLQQGSSSNLGVKNMPARAQKLHGDDAREAFNEVYDVISAVDLTFYSERFLEFIQKVFPSNGD
ncbi:1-phosphatidylinositol-4-phosphate 5-kinase [Salvia divinorum]|uniref:1-phosphatidylinositol-4-phosphate 5-kinase n=1 Tax=Salvia divinorum TaxID=28513 RepID=A0ABD1H253_SALDI